MKHLGFTLLELIFIIVIIGILSGVAFYSFKPNYLHDDTANVLMQLEVAHYQGIDYDKAINALGNYDSSNGCIDLTKMDRNTTLLSNTRDYKFHSSITITPENLNILCFDKFGRTFDGEQDDNTTDIERSLLHNDTNITLTYRNKQISILIDHKSGHPRVLYK